MVPGQSFNWQKLGADDFWVGTIGMHPVIFAKEAAKTRVASLDNRLCSVELNALVYDYLQLDVNVKELYALVRQTTPAYK